MKLLFPALIFGCLFLSCQSKSDDQHHDHAHDTPPQGGNQELYDKVMAVHDEVMPKMNDLHKAKTSLQTRLKLPGVPDGERKEIQLQIARIDSASEAMMVWMRQFQPPADSTGEEKARKYLENELIKVRKVKEDILSALETSPTHP